MNKIITIILPVFNGEKFIERCLDSIVNQSVDRQLVSVLVIDDGSKDKSVDRINRYVKKYPEMIALVTKKNSGVANTRNLGISMVKTEFLTFLDQDDWLEPDFLKESLAAIADNIDVVQGGFNLCDGNGRKVKIIYPVETEFGKFLAIPAWAKIYRTDFLQKNKITFFDNNIGEDNVFTVNVIKKARYKAIKYAGYNYYFENDQSVTNALHKGLSSKVNFMALLDALCEVSKNEGLLEYNIIRTAYYYLLSYGRYATLERFIEVSEVIDKWFEDNNINVYKNKWVWHKPKGEKISATIGIWLLMIVKKTHLIKLFAIIYTKGE